jgi:hypothetical protein
MAVSFEPEKKAAAEEAIKSWAHESNMSRYRMHYEYTGDPRWVWHAYRVARDAEREIPAWVLEYFDACSGALSDTSTRSRDLSAALGWRKPKRLASRNLTIIQTVSALERMCDRERQAGEKPSFKSRDEIIQHVADKRNLNFEWVRDIFYGRE